MEGKSGGHSAPILLTPEIVGRLAGGVMPASRAPVELMGGCRRDNLDRGRLRRLDAMLIPSRAAAERSAVSLCRAR